MKVSAVFENVDLAEIAARHVSESGVVIQKRRIVDLNGPHTMDSHLPTDEFYVPAAAEFYTGMAIPANVMTPGMPFYPMGGHVDSYMPHTGEAKLELEVSDGDVHRVRELLLGMHGTGIHSHS